MKGELRIEQCNMKSFIFTLHGITSRFYAVLFSAVTSAVEPMLGWSGRAVIPVQLLLLLHCYCTALPVVGTSPALG